MYQIFKITSHPTIDFSAEELKKYLRMMMPRCGEIPISLSPETTDGFRIGLMEDFGLDMSDAEDTALDDIVYLDADEHGGIIAGSNPGATLIAVYRYLRFQNCRWLFPGVDGECIPTVDTLRTVQYRKKADHRYRGQCNEGAEYQSNMIETIDFTPKIGMNTYMIEFDIPSAYYNRYYEHQNNPYRAPERITDETVLQWKRQCEAEIQKRGLHFHDMGHGWTAEPYGFDSKLRSIPTESYPPETLRHIAMLNGKREFAFSPINTNVCMSHPETRQIMAKYIADYAETQNNVDFLHIWLADDINNHCECEECRKKNASDWYIITLNEIDAELTKRNLNTHLVFIVYTETFWPPMEARLNDPKRFTMLYAPISRKYTETYGETPDTNQLVPYQLNNNKHPRGMAACLAYLKEWQKIWNGDCFCYEYHFWRQQYKDTSNMYLAKLLYDDITSLRKQGLSGIVEDGSQRSFFPTGFPFYVYGETLFDTTVSYDELKKDYFTHAFGNDWDKVVTYLETVRDLLDYRYLSGLCSADASKGSLYNPEYAVKAAQVRALTDSFAEVIAANKDHHKRACAVAWRLLDCHREYVNGLAEAVEKKALGDNIGAKESFDALMNSFAKREIYIERYYDHFLNAQTLTRCFNVSVKNRNVTAL